MVSGGDVTRGRQVYFGKKAACSSCHTIGLEGGDVGPDLTAVGAVRSVHDLIEAIIFPSASFVPGHEIYRVETADDVYSGVLRRRNAEYVVIVSGPQRSAPDSAERDQVDGTGQGVVDARRV